MGIVHYIPIIFCITDGEPTDDFKDVANRLKLIEEKKRVNAFCVGIDGFNKSIMFEIFKKERIFELKNLNFTSLFKWFFNDFRFAYTHAGSISIINDVDIPDLQKCSMKYLW